jgi:hypothetical protein
MWVTRPWHQDVFLHFAARGAEQSDAQLMARGGRRMPRAAPAPHTNALWTLV